jgi:hypothetical protein
MNKGPSFKFFPGEYLRDTQCLSEKAQVAYDRIICEHMRNICICKNQFEFFTKRLSEDEIKGLLTVLTKTEEGYQIDWVVESVNKSAAYKDSRRKNRLAEKTKNNKNISKSYDKDMYSKNEFIQDNISIDKNIINNNIKELYNSIVIFFDENCRPKNEKQKNEWLDTLDKLVRIDGYSTEHIQNIIKRTRMDDFWRNNFLSVLKLRKKNNEGIMYFTVFEKKMTYGNKKNIGADTGELAVLMADKLGVIKQQ